MRAVLIMRGYSVEGSGGAERRFARLFNLLRSREKNVSLIVNSNLYNSLIKAEVLENNPQNVFIIDDKNLNVQNLYFFNQSVIELITKIEPKVIHLPLIQKSLLPLYIWLYRHRQYKVVNTVALSWFAYKNNIPLSTKLLAKLIWERADLIDSLYPGYLKFHGAKYFSKTTITPASFTDIHKFQPVFPKQNIITFAGRLNNEKNPLVFIKALKMLSDTYPLWINSWRVNILGKGPLENELRRSIKKYNLDDVVKVFSLSSIHTYLAQSKVFVSLQRTENYPSQSLLEAMACSNAIIATDVGETRKLIDGSNGLLIENDNHLQLMKAIYYLISRPKACLKFGELSREKVVNNYSMDIFTRYIEEIWNGVTTNKQSNKDT